MIKKITLLTLAGVIIAGSAYGSGFRIPEQSINSVALSGAYIANANGPDSSYFNPANMSWAEDSWQLEADLTYINLSHINYTDNRSLPFNADGSSETENFFLPQFHAVSKDYNNLRFGFSLAYPFGLTKRWEDPFPAASAKKFCLEVIEANPTVSYKFSPKISFGAGVRVLKAEGDVKSNYITGGVPTNIIRDLHGDTIELGYNLAMTVKPIEQWAISATYRSKVDLDIEGRATLSAPPLPGALGLYDGDAEVSVVTPAVLSVGTSYSFDKTTVELTWDRTFWSKYEELDFDYDQDLTGHPLFASFDNPLIRDWDDTDAFRIGITHKCTDKLTTMVGFGIDENPVPERTLGFELPDSDATLYSIGFRYQKTDNLQLGAAYLYDEKDSRKVTNSSIDGEFEDASAQLFTIGFIYTY